MNNKKTAGVPNQNAARHSPDRRTKESPVKKSPWKLDPLFTPRSIAVIGASPNGGAGSIVLRNMQRLGYTGTVKAALVLWPGLCAIHARFHPEQIEAVRKGDPSCKVIVHPECSPEVVRAADGAGSTTYIIEYVRNAPDGAHIYVGTEINLVERLAREQEGRIRVEALRSSACSNMAKITPEKLRATLEGIVAGNTDPITVPSEDSAPAKASLERMLEACA